MSRTLVIRRNAEFMEAEVDGELVALHVDKGTCYGFNATATRIWNLLAEPKTLAELHEAVIFHARDLRLDVLGAQPLLDGVDGATHVVALLRDLEADGLVAIEG